MKNFIEREIDKYENLMEQYPGFKNVTGSNCYISSGLIILLSCSEFIKNLNDAKSDDYFIKAFLELLTKPNTIGDFIEKMQQKFDEIAELYDYKKFDFYKQQDVSEFLLHFFNKILNKTLDEEYSQVVSPLLTIYTQKI